MVEKVISVLGLNWSTFSDKFFYDLSFLMNKLSYEPTKRSVLSSIATIFDPLGYLSPYIMYCKILFQDLWKFKLNWDDSLPIDIKNRYDSWLRSSESLKSYPVNRCFFPNYAWSELRDVQLHMFSDASTRGYGCSVYVRAKLPTDEYSVILVCARSRVSPIKEVTLPKLELLGAFIGSRLLNYVSNALNLNDCPQFCYSDSTITLDWINSNPLKKDVFVGNKIKEILKYTKANQWYHCKGSENPADLITRGLLGHELMNNELWLYGPNWLSQGQYLPAYKPTEISESANPTEPSISLNVGKFMPFIDVNRFSCLIN